MKKHIKRTIIGLFSTMIMTLYIITSTAAHIRGDTDWNGKDKQYHFYSSSFEAFALSSN